MRALQQQKWRLAVTVEFKNSHRSPPQAFSKRLVEIVGLKCELFQAEGKLFEAFGANMDDTVLVLEPAMYEEESAASNKQAVVVVQVGMDDDI